jgi:cytochrome b561
MTTESSSWNTFVKSVHWMIALAMLIVVPAGFAMAWTYGPSFRDASVLKLHILASQIHHTLGVLVLIAALAWVARRMVRGRPPWHTELSRPKQVLALAVHGLLLGLLVVIPWSGWTALSALADTPQFGPTHMWFFGFDWLLPRIWTPLPFDDASGYARFARVHRWALWAGAGLVLLHIAAALWHHLVRRDSILRQMWPLGTK